MPRIDAHQHFWKFDPVRDNWITEEMLVIRADFMPVDLQPHLLKNGFSGCVAVQADQSENETRFLLGLAEEYDFIRAVVGWIDLRAADISDRLNYWQTFPLLKGFRHIIQAEQRGFTDDPLFRRGIALLKDYGFTYDILIRAGQLPEVIRLVEDNPDQKFVLDHIAKPGILRGQYQPWADDIRKLAMYPNICCKLSGMVTEADLAGWKNEDIYPYIDVVMDCFGPRRLMFGSDWPVCKLAAGYEEVAGLVNEYIQRLSADEQRRIWTETAGEFYDIQA